MNSIEKAHVRSRLVDIFYNPMSQRDICLSVIAICMLDSIPTTEELSHHDSSLQSRFCE